jgi:hypothetical protein
MSTTMRNEPEIEAGRLPTILARTLAEGYGPGAWHGPDLGSAVSDVTPETAFQRPMAGRHNIAEIALHHAWYVQVVTGRLTGKPTEPFPIEGEDWFELDADGALSWTEVRTELAARHAALTEAVAALGGGGARSPLSPAEQLDVVLGITCHAVYHAGQIQLIKRLLAG